MVTWVENADALYSDEVTVLLRMLNSCTNVSKVSKLLYAGHAGIVIILSDDSEQILSPNDESFLIQNGLYKKI